MYKIIATYKNCNKEVIEVFKSKILAETMLKEYRFRFGSDYTLWITQQREEQEIPG